MATNDITQYKNTLLSEIINNDEIVAAIDSKSKGYVKGINDSLIGINIFPMFFIPDIQTNADTYVCVEAEIMNQNGSSKTFHDLRITVYVMAHKDRMYMPEHDCNRIDYISDRLKEMLQDSNKYGYGTLNLTANKLHLLNPKYAYRQLEFKTFDLKKAICSF